MRKIHFIFLAIVFNFFLTIPALAQYKVGYPAQCTNSATNPTTAEWITCTQARAGTSVLNPLYTTSTSSTNQNQFYTGVTWVNWSGQTAGVDNLTNSTPAPFIYNLNYGFDGTNWDRIRVAPASDALGATPSGQLVLSLNTYYDGSNFRRLLGGTLTDNMTQPTLPYNASFQMVWDGSTWDRMKQTLGNASDAISITQEGNFTISLGHFYDGANFLRWFGGTGNDGVSATTSAPYTHGFLHAYDGSTWDRITVTSAADNLSVTRQGLDTISLGHFSDGSNFRRWTGVAVGADAISNSSPAPWTGNLNYGFNGTSWDRIRTAEGAKGTGVLRVNLATDDNAVTALGQIETAVEILDNVVGTQSSATPSSGTVVGYHDGTNFQRLAGETYDGSIAGTVAPLTIGLNAYWNNSSAARWAGEDWDTAIDVVTNAPAVLSLGTFYDLGTTKGYRWSGELWDASMTVATPIPSMNAYSVFYNDTGSDATRLHGLATHADGISNSNAMPWTAIYNYNYNGTTWDRVTKTTAGDALSATLSAVPSLSLGTFYNGTNYQRWTGTTALPTSVSPPAAPYVGSMLYGYDSVGAVFRPVLTDSTGTVYTIPKYDAPGHDSVNDRVDVYSVGSDTYEPTAPAAQAVVAAEVPVIGWTKTLNYSYVEVWVKNVGGGGGGPFTNCHVYLSPDGTDANQHDISALMDTVETESKTATAGQAKMAMRFIDAPAWVKVTVQAAAAANDTTATGYLVTRK